VVKYSRIQSANLGKKHTDYTLTEFLASHYYETLTIQQ